MTTMRMGGSSCLELVPLFGGFQGSQEKPTHFGGFHGDDDDDDDDDDDHTNGNKNVGPQIGTSEPLDHGDSLWGTHDSLGVSHAPMLVAYFRGSKWKTARQEIQTRSKSSRGPNGCGEFKRPEFQHGLPW